MTIKVIPEQRSIICDRCGSEIESGSARRLHILDEVHDVFGNGAGSHRDYDLCHACAGHFDKFLRQYKDHDE